MGEGEKESEVGASEPALPEGVDSEGWLGRRMDLDGDAPDTRAPLSKAMKELQRRWRDTVRIGEQLFTPDELVGCVVLDTNGVAIGVTLAGLGDKEERRYVGLVVNAEPFWKEEDWRGLGISGSMAASIESTIYVPMGQISEFRKGDSELVLRCSVSRLVTLPSFLRMNEIEPLTLHQWSPEENTELAGESGESQAELEDHEVVGHQFVKKLKAAQGRLYRDVVVAGAQGLKWDLQRWPIATQIREEIRLHLLEKAGGQPKYAYSNELLDEIVRIKPRSKSDLEKIRGMGPRRMESSEEILQIIDRWMISECVSAIRENLNLFTSEEGVGLFLSSPEKLDEIGSYFAQWLDGRGKVSKRTSSVEATEEILRIIYDTGIMGIRVNDLREVLAGNGMEFSPSRLSQLLQPLVKDGLLERSRFGRGIVVIELTEKGRFRVSEGRASAQ